MSERISEFSHTRFKVYLSSGPCYRPMLVNVHTFHTRDSSFGLYRRLVNNEAGSKPKLVKCYSPAIGINGFSQDIRGRLIDHIEQIVDGERNYGEVLWGNTSQLVWDVHETIRQYLLSNPKVSIA